MHALPGFACSVCGRPLGARRVRQGVRLHPGCRRPTDAPALEELGRALATTTATLERWRARALAGDAETRRLFALAAQEAQRLLHDLERLRHPPAVTKLPNAGRDAPAAESLPQEIA